METTPFGHRARFVILILVVLCLTSVWSNILAFNFALICMNPEDEGRDEAAKHGDSSEEADVTRSYANSSAIDPDNGSQAVSFTAGQQTYAISIVPLAAIIANFPVIFLLNKFGIRTIFGFGGLLSAVATILIPFGIKLGYPYFMALRFLQGLAFAANLPAIGAFCAKWAYYKQNGLFIASTVAYLQIAPAFTNPVSGPICEHMGWESVFYLHGCVGLALFVLYGLFYRNSPGKHPFVGDIESNKIGIGKPTKEEKKDAQQVPYLQILMTPSIWGVWIAAIGNFVVVNLIFLYSPTYMSKVLGFSVSHSGFTSALGPLAQAAVKVSVGGLSDRMKFLSEVTKLRIFNSIAFFGCFVLLYILTFVSTEYSTMCVLLWGAASGIIGANTGGFFRAAPILSKQYSHFVTGNISLAITITMVIVPFVVNGLVKDNEPEEWNLVFRILGAVMAITNIIYLILVRGEACSWTELKSRPGKVAPISQEKLAVSETSSQTSKDTVDDEKPIHELSVINYSNQYSNQLY
ncbi:unnamed protein product, partial [Mesorhabditis spiculigera]